MSIRVDSSSLIAGAVVVGDPGLGVLAELVPSTGEHGPGIASTWLGPAEAGKEVRVLITQWPEVGSLFVWEDTSFEYNGPGGTAYAQLYVEGQPVDTPQTVTVTVGATTSVSADVSAAYGIRGQVQRDVLASYDIRSAVFADTSATYVTQGRLSVDWAFSYRVLGDFGDFPDPATVLLGTVYGPGGIYVGTLPPGGDVAAIAAAVWAAAPALTIGKFIALK